MHGTTIFHRMKYIRFAYAEHPWNETNALKAFACLKADDRARFVVWLFLLVPYLLTVLIRQHLASIVIVKTFNWLSCFYLARYETTRYTDSVGCILHAIELFSSFKANNRFSFSHSVRPLSNETVFLVFIFLSRDFSLLQELFPRPPSANAWLDCFVGKPNASVHTRLDAEPVL